MGTELHIVNSKRRLRQLTRRWLDSLDTTEPGRAIQVVAGPRYLQVTTLERSRLNFQVPYRPGVVE